ncbi:MAG: helix-turn-helix domain-containing protein [Ktedonobacteraceae bacterium]|nr:helix-turn-helix domain-containing protein [Ktedonobacteraceae bacterium]
MKQTRVHPPQAIQGERVQPLWSVADVMSMLSLSRPKVYALIASEGLPTVRFGRAIRIVPASFQRWLAQREQAQ